MVLSINIDTDETIGRTGKLLDAHFMFGDKYEKCSLPLDYWTPSDYVSQWISTLSHVADSGSQGAMVTSIRNPAIAVNLVAWVLYPLGDGSVKIQQHFLLHQRFVLDD